MCATDVAKDQGHHKEIATTFGCASRWHDEASGLRSGMFVSCRGSEWRVRDSMSVLVEVGTAFEFNVHLQ